MNNHQSGSHGEFNFHTLRPIFKHSESVSSNQSSKFTPFNPFEQINVENVPTSSCYCHYCINKSSKKTIKIKNKLGSIGEMKCSGESDVFNKNIFEKKLSRNTSLSRLERFVKFDKHQKKVPDFMLGQRRSGTLLSPFLQRHYSSRLPNSFSNDNCHLNFNNDLKNNASNSFNETCPFKSSNDLRTDTFIKNDKKSFQFSPLPPFPHSIDSARKYNRNLTNYEMKNDQLCIDDIVRGLSFDLLKTKKKTRSSEA